MINKEFKNAKSIGKSGTEVSSGVYTEEYLTTLQGYQASQVYNRMRRSDPQVRKLLSAIFNPIKSAVWDIVPASDDTKDLGAAALIDRILFHDLNWIRKLSEMLTYLIHGHSLFEVIHENKVSKEFGEYTGLANLAFRNQTTLTEWKHDEVTGELKEIHQQQSGDIVVDTWIPAENLLIFFNEKEGDDNGTSLLRALYGPYKRKLLSEELKIIGIERFAIPTPKAKVPSNIKPSDQEYKDAETILENFTSAENSYLMYPDGWEVELHDNTFDPSKVQASIKAENEEMSGAVVAIFLELGTGGNSGAYALGADLSDFFLAGIEHYARIISDTINNELIPNLIFHNFGDSIEVMPKLSVSGISDKAGKELMEIITGYSATGIITADEQLEDYVRRVYNLPKKLAGEMVENQETEDEPESKPDPELEDDNDGSENNSDSSDDNDSDPVPEPEENVESDETVELAEKEPKNSRALIKRSEEGTRVVMQSNLTFIKEKLIADIMKKYRQLPEGSKLNAVKDINIGGVSKFKKQLKGSLSQTGIKSLELAIEQVPPAADTKLKDNMKLLKELDPKGRIKLQDFSKLPKHVQALLTLQANSLAEKQSNELKDKVTFQFMSSESSTKDPDIIEQHLNEAADGYITGPQVRTGAANAASAAVNETQKSFFMDPEVNDLIESYTFVNPDPVSAICQKLAGSTFDANDQEALNAYYPPLHHNCKSVMRANLVSSKNTPKVTGVPGISKAEKDSITLKEKK